MELWQTVNLLKKNVDRDKDSRRIDFDSNFHLPVEGVNYDQRFQILPRNDAGQSFKKRKYLMNLCTKGG